MVFDPTEPNVGDDQFSNKYWNGTVSVPRLASAVNLACAHAHGAGPPQTAKKKEHIYL